MRGRTTIGINDDLTAGKAGITVRTTNHKATRRVDIDFISRRHPTFRKGRFDIGQNQFANSVLSQAFGMLGRNNHRGRCNRLAPSIAQGYLAFGIRAELRGFARVTVSCHGTQDTMRKLDRCRHQFICFVTSVTKHDPLVTSAKVFFTSRINTLSNINRLFMHMAVDLGRLPVEAFLLVANVTDCLTGLFDHDLCGHAFWATNFTRQNHTVGGCKRFNGNARIFIRRKKGINDGIGNAVTDFVRMTFRDGFTGK